ncbi:MAG: hypothetical protein AAF517_15715 [Planctomycetota bacterium]
MRKRNFVYKLSRLTHGNFDPNPEDPPQFRLHRRPPSSRRGQKYRYIYFAILAALIFCVVMAWTHRS